MNTRLQWAIALTSVIYTLWACFGLWWAYRPSPIEAGANVLVGLLLGFLFTFLSEFAENPLAMAQLGIQIVFSGLLFAILAAFSTRTIVVPYITAQAVDGIGFGAVMWLIGYLPIGAQSHYLTERILTVAVFIAGVFAAPLMSTVLFNGALFAAAAVGARIFGSVTITHLSQQTQAFLFGTVVGVCIFALPGISFFSYGSY